MRERGSCLRISLENHPRSRCWGSSASAVSAEPEGRSAPPPFCQTVSFQPSCWRHLENKWCDGEEPLCFHWFIRRFRLVIVRSENKNLSRTRLKQLIYPAAFAGVQWSERSNEHQASIMQKADQWGREAYFCRQKTLQAWFLIDLHLVQSIVLVNSNWKMFPKLGSHLASVEVLSKSTFLKQKRWHKVPPCFGIGIWNLLQCIFCFSYAILPACCQKSRVQRNDRESKAIKRRLLLPRAC